jgi:crotonobetainyl-CoA:carnitine CoA-transferase CaiB-like acyl-CoA transferase
MNLPPHGAFQTQGVDRWIAIAVFAEEHWRNLVDVLGLQIAASDKRFATLQQRLAHQDELEAIVSEATRKWDGLELMQALQARKVPAGVAQTAQQRIEEDPQLKHLGWLTELNQTEIGRWPTRGLPVHFSETPAHIGGRLNRAGPNYGEDNEYVLRNILKMSSEAVEEMRKSGAL